MTLLDALRPWLPRRRRLTLRDAGGFVYLDRWGVEVPRLGGILLHRIDRPDPGLDLHDHPWRFRSLVLAGSYTEDIGHGIARHRPRWSYAGHDLDERHRIAHVEPGTWTLVVRGPHRQTWGFFLGNGNEWVPWNEYDYQTRRPGSATSNKAEEEHAVAGPPLTVDETGAISGYIARKNPHDHADVDEAWAEVEHLIGVDVDPPLDETGAFVEIEAHQSSRDPEPAWCPRCNLRSAFEVEQILARSDTLDEIGRFRLTVCLDCGWSDPPAEEEPTP